MEDDFKPFVRKIGNIERNLERYKELRRWDVNIPMIYSVGPNHYDMEYINNMDVTNYLLASMDIGQLVRHIQHVVLAMATVSKPKDYTQTYIDKLADVDLSGLKFCKQDLIDRLPKMLVQTAYHGDFTLENMLYDYGRQRFVMIDPLTSVYDSVIFDLAKLRQDLVCKWFIRKSPAMLGSKLDIIYDALKSTPSFDDPHLLILMLLRVLPYTQNDFDKNYLIDEMNRLWK